MTTSIYLTMLCLWCLNSIAIYYAVVFTNSGLKRPIVSHPLSAVKITIYTITIVLCYDGVVVIHWWLCKWSAHISTQMFWSHDALEFWTAYSLICSFYYLNCFRPFYLQFTWFNQPCYHYCRATGCWWI